MLTLRKCSELNSLIRSNNNFFEQFKDPTSMASQPFFMWKTADAAENLPAPSGLVQFIPLPTKSMSLIMQSSLLRGINPISQAPHLTNRNSNRFLHHYKPKQLGFLKKLQDEKKLFGNNSNVFISQR